ncbi:MAG: hypothetical protein ACOC0D_07030, partial [Spirochaeta sp.]
MIGIGIGTLLFFTRMIGGAAASAAIQIAGQFVFMWNAVLIGTALVSVLWFLTRGDTGTGRRPETAMLSGLLALFGMAGTAYLLSGKARLWYAGSFLVLLGSGILAFAAEVGLLTGISAVAVLWGGHYLRVLHRQKAAETAGGTGTHQSSF